MRHLRLLKGFGDRDLIDGAHVDVESAERGDRVRKVPAVAVEHR